MRTEIRFIFRGREERLSGFSARRTLLDWLREERRAVGTKEGCNEGDCGACTVALVREDGIPRPVNACIVLLGMVDGAELVTVEDLADATAAHPVQQALVDHHGSQCGFCTPGIVMSLFALHESGAAITRAAVEEQLQGNLCRCTGYRPIVDAALAADSAPRRFRPSPLRSGLDGDGPAMVPTAGGGFFAIPRRLDEAASLAAEHPDATILAGATDVGLWITKRLDPIARIIWLGRVAELATVATSDGALTLGAMVSHDAAIPHLAAIDPDLATLGQRFGSRQVRTSGTVGGNLANGSPIGDWSPAFIALGASLHLRHGEATRSLPLEDFFLAYGRQDRRPGELVTGVRLATLGPGDHFRAFKLSRRFDEDISAVMGALRLRVEAGRIVAARVAFGGMAATPKRAPRLETALVGLDLTAPATWGPAVATLAQDYTPIDDLRASAAYRLHGAQGLVLKALAEIGGLGAETRLRPRQEATLAA